jgi:hypothetical protein
VVALAESVRKYGIKEPLVVSADGWILSGHRRYIAAQIAGLSGVPCRVDPIRRDTDPDGFLVLLREHNRQRIKSFDEIVHEEVLSASDNDQRAAVFKYRRDRAAVDIDPLVLRDPKERAHISEAKAPMLATIRRVLEEQRKYWPLTDRRIHYSLLNDPPLKHASKPKSIYRNDAKSYESLTELLTRARLAGLIPMEAIEDPTRPVTVWTVHPDPSSFVRKELDGFLKGYWRDLLRSQPNHIEIMVEKNTVEPIVRPIAMEYTIPLMSGRGYSSLSPRAAMAERFLRGGKEKLVLLMLTDFDPDGQEISHSFAASMRDDFGIKSIVPVKVALTAEQVGRFKLPPMMKAKTGSSNYKRFAEIHGDNTWELEALSPIDLQAVLREAVEGVLDCEAFTHETEEEAKDLSRLGTLRQQAKQLLAGITV